MDLNLALTLVHDAADLLKNKKIVDFSVPYKEGYDYSIDEKRLPDFNPIYRETILLKNEIEVHSKKGVFPYRILRTKAPNQSPEEWEYQKGLYESCTNSTWNRAKNKTKIVSNSQNFSIDGWDEKQKEYFYVDYPDYHSLESFFFDIVREYKIDYPNKVLLVKPREYYGTYNEDGSFRPDQTQKIKPVSVLIDEENIIQYKDQEYLLILKSSCIKYKNGDDTRYDGLQFEFYDKNTITIFTQTGIGADHNASFEGGIATIYEHNWNYLPAQKLVGKPVSNKDGNVLYHSPYIDAVPDLNGVIRLSSNLDMSTYRLAFPIIIAVVDKCQYTSVNGQKCSGGQVFETEWKECPKCKGSGKQNNHSPTGVYEIAATAGLDGANTLPFSPPVQFVAPPSDILKYISDQIDVKKKSAFSFIFETEDASNKTATGKQLEKEEFHSFLIDFSNQLFNLLEFAIEAIGFMRYGETFKKPTIRKPTFFNFRTNEDITLEIGDSIKNNLPLSYRKLLIQEANKTRFNNNPRADKELNLIMMMDRVWGMDDLTIRANIGSTLGKLDAVIHDSITTFIDNAVRLDPGFWDKPFETQQTTIMAMANDELIKLVPVGGVAPEML